MTGLRDILDSFGARGGRTALVYRSGIRRFEVSYAALYLRSCKMAAYLESRGVNPGDRVVIWGPNSPAWVVAFWGVVARGGVVVPVDFMSGAERAKSIALHAQASFAIQSRAKLEHLAGIPSVMLEDLEPLLEPLAPATAFSQHVPEDTCELVYTSGTTGDPKGVVLTHRNLIANLAQIETQFPVITGDYRFLSLLPLSHMFEQMAGFLAPLSLGGSVIYLRTLKPSAIMAAFAEEDVYALVAVPRLLQLLKGSVEQAFAAKGLGKLLSGMLSFSARLSPPWRRFLFFPVQKRFGRHFKLFISGGAPLSRELFHFWSAAGFTVVEGYGLTECSPVLTANTIEMQLPGAVGWPLPGVEARLVAGEVQVRGDNVFSGYYRNEAATRAAFTADGWFRTGDLGEFDAAGALVIKGRAKDLIVTGGGVNVYPEEIENVLARLPGVRDACVIGVERGGGEEVHAVLVPDGSGRPLNDIVTEANHCLDELHRISGFSLWPEPELPKTTTMKVKRFAVKERILLHAERQGEQASAVDPLSRLIVGILGCDPGDVTEEAFLVADLGLTSIARLELVNMLEQEFRVDLDDAAIGPQTRVADLRAMVSRREKMMAPRGLRLWTAGRSVRTIRLLADLFLHRPLFSLFVSLEVEGLERLAGPGSPVIFIANHTSYLDQPSIMFSLPAAVRYRSASAAWAEFFFVNYKNPLQRLWKLAAFEYSSLALGVFPLPQTSGFRAALGHMGRLVDKGFSVLIFPEGARTQDARLLPFQEGLAVMVRELAIPVVPVAINGLEHVLPRGALWPRRGRVTVTFGKVIDFSREEQGDIVRRAETAVRQLMQDRSR